MKYLIGIDIGTSGTKSVLFDPEGKVVASATEEYPMYQPKNGWAEQNPNDWWRAVYKTLCEITQNVDGEICGIGLSGQMHGLVMLDENNEVIRNAIIWCDGRTAEECKEIEELVGHDRLIEITANPAMASFTAAKMMWVKKHEPENFKRCRHILLPKDYIRFMLTGVFATDVSDASGMQLLDVGKRCWSDEVLKKLEIDEDLLAKVYESPEVTGYVTENAAKACGLTNGIPVAAGAGDNAAAAIGTGVCENKKAFTTIGTSVVVFAHTDKMIFDKQGRIHTFCCAVPGAWHVMGVTQAAGLSLSWFRNNFARDLSYGEIDKLCESIPIGAEKLIYLPYLMGERTPILDIDARGVFFGLSAMHTKAHLARAIMEGVSYSLKNCLDVLNEVGVGPADMALCGGGSKGNFWRGMIADVFDMPVKIMQSDEGPALGAAILAGCAAGVFKNVQEGCTKLVKVKEEQPPVKENHMEYEKFYSVYNGLYPALKDSFSRLAKIL